MVITFPSSEFNKARMSVNAPMGSINLFDSTDQNRYLAELVFANMQKNGML